MVLQRKLKPGLMRMVLAGGALLILLVGAYFFLFSDRLFEGYFLEEGTAENLADWRLMQTDLSAAQREILEHAPHFELLSLHPLPLLRGQSLEESIAMQFPEKHFDAKDVTEFQRYISWGARTVTAEERKGLLSTLYMSIAKGGEPAQCFIPHHGIRARTAEGRTLDLVICFTCSRMRVVDGLLTTTVYLNEAGRAYFDQILTRHGLPVAENL